MTNQTTFDLDTEIENELKNENGDINTMIFENPMDDPQKAISDFFIAWRWPEAKAQLWKMCKAAACSIELNNNAKVYIERYDQTCILHRPMGIPCVQS